MHILREIKNIKTYLYNQYQQSYILGYLAALVTTSNMNGANSWKRIGFILAQEFPLITNDILPGFKDGAKKSRQRNWNWC